MTKKMKTKWTQRKVRLFHFFEFAFVNALCAHLPDQSFTLLEPKKADDENDGEGDTPKRRNRKRKQPDEVDDIEEGRAKRRKKATTTPRRAPDFQQGKAQAGVKPIIVDPTFFSEDAPVNTSCCGVCASREVLRGIYLKDKTFLDNALKCTKVYAYNSPRSITDPVGAFITAIRRHDMASIKTMADVEDESVHDGAPVSSLTVRQLLFFSRLVFLQSLTFSVSLFKGTGTGTYSKYTYGHRVAKLAAGRGGKEGNNALVGDVDEAGNFVLHNYHQADIAKEAMKAGISIEFMTYLNETYGLEDQLHSSIVEGLLEGHVELTHHVIGLLIE